LKKIQQHTINVLKVLLYPLLAILSILFSIILFVRHFLYDKKILKSYSFENVLVICIGNLNFGGSGKSPFTNYLIELLKHKYKIAVLSRGYGRKSKGFRLVEINNHFSEVGDEPLMYKLKHPEITVAVCEDRVFGIQQILNQYPSTQIILLDDAFQHRKVKAHLNILLTEFSKPFYKDYLFPLGKLRDLKSSCHRAEWIIVSKVPENTDEEQINHLSEKIKHYYKKEVFFNSIEYQNFYSLFSPEHKINIYKELAHYNCILITGIANPLPLATFIKEYAQHFYHLKYPDHYNFSEKDIDLILELFKSWQEKHPPAILVTTEKDAVRLKTLLNSYSNLPIFVAPIQLNFEKYSPSFNSKLLTYVATNSRNN
jgi:tetraacyldisaccharide 4'-kinase